MDGFTASLKRTVLGGLRGAYPLDLGFYRPIKPGSCGGCVLLLITLMLSIGGLFRGVAYAELFNVGLGGDLVAFGSPLAEVDEFTTFRAEGAPAIFWGELGLFLAGWALYHWRLCSCRFSCFVTHTLSKILFSLRLALGRAHPPAGRVALVLSYCR